MSTTETTANGTAPETKTKPNTFTIHLSFQDVPVDIALTDTRISAVEQLITGALARGWKPAKPAQIGGFGPRKPAIEPKYAPDGSPCCPHHDRPLKKLDFGWVCSQKLEATDPLCSPRGYCKYVWKDGK